MSEHKNAQREKQEKKRGALANVAWIVGTIVFILVAQLLSSMVAMATHY